MNVNDKHKKFYSSHLSQKNKKQIETNAKCFAPEKLRKSG
jgi:hypothetical protein